MHQQSSWIVPLIWLAALVVVLVFWRVLVSLAALTIVGLVILVLATFLLTRNLESL